MAFSIGDVFEKHVYFSREDVLGFARLVEDTNPMHRDEAFARSTRFGGLIASGAQPVAYLMAFCADSTTNGMQGVGLEFTFRFKGAVKPDAWVTLRWRIVASEPKPKLGGDIVTLEGAVLAEDGTPLVEAHGAVLSTRDL